MQPGSPPRTKKYQADRTLKEPVIDVIIPVFNEEQSIGLVLQEIPKRWVREVVVCNNGSTDRTAAVAKAGGATVLDEPRKGYGSACLRGIAYLSGRPAGLLLHRRLRGAGHQQGPRLHDRGGHRGGRQRGQGAADAARGVLGEGRPCLTAARTGRSGVVGQPGGPVTES